MSDHEHLLNGLYQRILSLQKDIEGVARSSTSIICTTRHDSGDYHYNTNNEDGISGQSASIDDEQRVSMRETIEHEAKDKLFDACLKNMTDNIEIIISNQSLLVKDIVELRTRQQVTEQACKEISSERDSLKEHNQQLESEFGELKELLEETIQHAAELHPEAVTTDCTTEDEPSNNESCKLDVSISPSLQSLQSTISQLSTELESSKIRTKTMEDEVLNQFMNLSRRTSEWTIEKGQLEAKIAMLQDQIRAMSSSEVQGRQYHSENILTDDDPGWSTLDLDALASAMHQDISSPLPHAKSSKQSPRDSMLPSDISPMDERKSYHRMINIEDFEEELKSAKKEAHNYHEWLDEERARTHALKCVLMKFTKQFSPHDNDMLFEAGVILVGGL